MAKDKLIQPLVLPPDEFPPLPLDPGFAKLVEDELGGVATPTDGWDQIMADAIAIVDALDAALGALAGDLLSAFAEADLIDPQAVGATVDGFSASLAPTSSAVDDLGTLLGAASVPSPGGGGGGAATLPIGAATSPVLPCDAVQGFQVLPGIAYPELAELSFVNPTAAPIKVLKLTLVQPAGGPFTVTTDCTAAAIAPGAGCRLTISLTRAAPNGTTAQLQILTDASAKPAVLCCTVGASNSGIGGGGGGGGHGPIVIVQAPTP